MELNAPQHISNFLHALSCDTLFSVEFHETPLPLWPKWDSNDCNELAVFTLVSMVRLRKVKRIDSLYAVAATLVGSGSVIFADIGTARLSLWRTVTRNNTALKITTRVAL